MVFDSIKGLFGGTDTSAQKSLNMVDEVLTHFTRTCQDFTETVNRTRTHLSEYDFNKSAEGVVSAYEGLYRCVGAAFPDGLEMAEAKDVLARLEEGDHYLKACVEYLDKFSEHSSLRLSRLLDDERFQNMRKQLGGDSTEDMKYTMKPDNTDHLVVT